MPPQRTTTSALQLHGAERSSSSNASNLDLTVRGAAAGDYSSTIRPISTVFYEDKSSDETEEGEEDAALETRSELGERVIKSYESEFIATQKTHVPGKKRNQPSRGTSAKATSKLPPLRSNNRAVTEKSILKRFEEQPSTSNLQYPKAPPSESQTIVLRPKSTMPQNNNNNLELLGTDSAAFGRDSLRKSGSASALAGMAGRSSGLGNNNNNTPSPQQFDNYPLDSEHHAGMVITSLNAEIRKLRRRVEAHDDINLENRLLKDENKQLKSQLTRLRSMATNGDKTLTELEEKHFQLEEDLTQKNNLIHALTRQSRDVDQKLSTRETENAQLQQLLDQKEQQLAELSEHKQQQSQLISTLNQRLQQLENDLSEKDQHIRTREDDHQTLLNDSRRRHVDDVERLTASQDQEKRFHAAEIASMAETLRDRQKTIDGIESRLLIALQQIEELQERIKQLSDDNQELRARASAAAAELGPKHRVTLLEERVAQLTRTNEDFKRKVPDLHYQIDKLQRKVDEAEGRTQRKVFDLVQMQKTELLRKECKVKELEEELEKIRSAAMNLNSNNPNAVSELITAMVASPAFGARRNISTNFQRSLSRQRMRSMSPSTSTARFGYEQQWSGYNNRTSGGGAGGGSGASGSLRRARRIGGSSNNLSGRASGEGGRTPKPTAALANSGNSRKGDNDSGLTTDEQTETRQIDNKSAANNTKSAARRRRERSQERRQI